jgi:hypothetical protein
VVLETLMHCLEAPRASMRMLCAFVAMHLATEARSGNASAQGAQPRQFHGLVEKLLTVLAMPACHITQTGAALHLQ